VLINKYHLNLKFSPYTSAVMKLVIVESPAKAKTINKYLGTGYKVLASYGHVRDLPSKDGSVDPSKNFAIKYQTDASSKKALKAIEDAAKKMDGLVLATDPDREGESISWHVLEHLRNKKLVKADTTIERVVFNAITKSAVTSAMQAPRDLDMHLVNAQQARRALDYLVGFNLSPILWRKLPGAKSAGRVQSVALRLICEREAEIEKFIPREYWDVKLELEHDKTKFLAKLTHADGEKLDKFSLNNEGSANKVVKHITGQPVSVTNITEKQSKRNPYAPFTTSTLQQEAARKLGYGAKRTMNIAQKLYEGADTGGGLITYMRTDGIYVAPEAITQARQVIADKYGNKYVPNSARMYQNKAKNAQEAHEAIRPTDISKSPQDVKSKLTDEQYKLYELIWKRMVASQMESAVIDQVAADITTKNNYAIFRATGSVINFDGFLKLYTQSFDTKEEEEKAKSTTLPKLTKGDEPDVKQILPEQHFTQAPPRYSEATLVKTLEEKGIGRPSTYASIISVLQDREYVYLDKKRFIPEQKGRIVTTFLTSFFTQYVEYDFTAQLEEELDIVSDGKMDWKALLDKFWQSFNAKVEDASQLTITEVLDNLNELLKDYLFPEKEDGKNPRLCPKCGTGELGLRLGKFGPFIGCSNHPDCTYTAQLSGDSSAEGDNQQIGDEPKVLGEMEGQPVTLRKGPYGHYLQLGEKTEENKKPKRFSIPKSTPLDSVDMAMANKFLSLPRQVGKHPDTGKVINANIGRYGPYLQHDGKFTSLKTHNVVDITLEQALEVLSAAPVKQSGLDRELGEHPDGSKVAIYKGRYGKYIKFGKKNVPIPKGDDADALTLEQAIVIINNKK